MIGIQFDSLRHFIKRNDKNKEFIMPRRKTSLRMWLNQESTAGYFLQLHS